MLYRLINVQVPKRRKRCENYDSPIVSVSIFKIHKCVYRYSYVQVKITKKGVTKNYNIKTPVRRGVVCSYACRNYRSSTVGVLNPTSGTSKHVLPLVAKQIRNEFNGICSTTFDSVLRAENKSLKTFKWETLLTEFSRKVPSLLRLLKLILPKAGVPFWCFIISVLLKKKNQNMSLMQRLVSVILYGNATHKQVSFLSFKIL